MCEFIAGRYSVSQYSLYFKCIGYVREMGAGTAAIWQLFQIKPNHLGVKKESETFSQVF